MSHTFIIARYGVNGGTGTLSIRMTKWLVNKGYKVIYMCCVDDNSSNRKELLQNGAEFILRNDTTYQEHFSQAIVQSNIYTVITYSLEEYLSFIKIQHFYSNLQRVFLYVVHSLTFGDENNKVGFIKKLFRRVKLRSFIHKIYLNGSLLFMDEMSLFMAQRIFGLKFSEPQKSIFYLPIEIKTFQIDIKNKLRKQNEPFIILTVTRMDFQFKGYVLVLVDLYVELIKKFKNIKLVIVGDGPDLGLLVNKIERLEKHLRAGIELIHRVPYAQLDQYFKSANLYIGMGTTILDAVNNSVPSIVAAGYVYNLSNVRYFNEKKGDVGSLAYLDCNQLNCIDLVDEILRMDLVEYQKFTYSQYCGLKENFDIDIFFTLLINRKIGKVDVYKSLPFRVKLILIPQLKSFIKALCCRINFVYN